VRIRRKPAANLNDLITILHIGNIAPIVYPISARFNRIGRWQRGVSCPKVQNNSHVGY
jgi:hypothetical protein